MLRVLALSVGETVPRLALAGNGESVSERTVDVQVNRLRRKIEPTGPRPTYIHAVPGIGYRFERRGLNERLSRNVTGSDETGLAS